ncbi:MAG: transporter substrate-binding domain-containing protein [Bacteriovoracaceae bacterium]|nr:transporter substrate-binding domain-containing protein [Bacteriovoracaceae bacterium]
MKTIFLIIMILLQSSIGFSRDTLAQIQKDKVLRIGIDVGYMPFEMKTKKGQIIGFDIDLAKLMAKEMGVKLKIVNTSWDGIIPALLTNKFDLILGGMSITPKRNLKVNFTTPYFEAGQSIIIAGKHRVKVKSYKDLNHKKFVIASRFGTTGELAIKKYLPRATLKTYEDRETGMLDVAFSRVDAFVYDFPANHVFSITKGVSKVVHIAKPFTKEPVGIAIRQDDFNFLNWLNNFLLVIKSDGRYKKIHDSWFVKTNWLAKVSQ